MADFIGVMDGFGTESGPVGPLGPGGIGAVTRLRRVRLNANSGDIEIGGEGAGGDLRVLDSNGDLRILFDGTGQDLAGPNAYAVVRITGSGTVRVGGAFPRGVKGSGSITLLDDSNRERIILTADTGDITLANEQYRQTVHLKASDGSDASLWLGGEQRNGRIKLVDAERRVRIELSADDGYITVRDGNDRQRAQVRPDGDIDLSDSAGRVSLKLRGESESVSGVWAGGEGRAGSIVARDDTGENRVALSGAQGEVRVYKADGKRTIELRGEGASGWFGGNGQAGDLLIFSANADNDSPEAAAIWLQGSTGDIVLRNADCAEEFEVCLGEKVDPGAVLVLDERGGMALCRTPYDECVAGVVSGADGVRPGIVLGRVPGAKGRWPVALAGKVMCNVDASFGPIKVGSLLTTSPNPGHAMVATDRERAFGAVIGKAMAPLEHGTGKVPVLVSLQ
jgi:hypothetical protein